jgi:7-carboxy-7-deazaguanine synthase
MSSSSPRNEADVQSIRISEIYGPTIQGEGALIGRPTVLVRTAGCDFRCAWCDTPHAVLPSYRREWSVMTPTEILVRVEALTDGLPVLVTLTGGNPALQPLGPLISRGKARGHRFALETQGSIADECFAELDWLVLSPKPPSSGMTTDWPAFDACLAAADGRPHTILKIVVFDDADYAWARRTAARHPALPVYLSVGNPQTGERAADRDDLLGRLRWLVDRVARDRWFEATVLPQLHVLAWGNARGV